MSADSGNIFWISPNEANRITSDHTHPYVVVQGDVSNIVTVCALTSNLKRAKEPGNVLLDEGEANLSRQSVIEVSKVYVVDKMQLGEYIGTLSEERIDQVQTGIRFLQHMVERHGSGRQKFI